MSDKTIQFTLNFGGSGVQNANLSVSHCHHHITACDGHTIPLVCSALYHPECFKE